MRTTAPRGRRIAHAPHSGLVLGPYLVRDGGRGAISFVQANINGQNGASPGSEKAIGWCSRQMAITSPRVTGYHALVTFARDAVTGKLPPDRRDPGRCRRRQLDPRHRKVSKSRRGQRTSTSPTTMSIHAISVYTRDPGDRPAHVSQPPDARRRRRRWALRRLRPHAQLRTASSRYETDANRISTFAARRRHGRPDARRRAQRELVLGHGLRATAPAWRSPRTASTSTRRARSRTTWPCSPRNQVTGKLTFVEERLEGVGGIDGLSTAVGDHRLHAVDAADALLELPLIGHRPGGRVARERRDAAHVVGAARDVDVLPVGAAGDPPRRRETVTPSTLCSRSSTNVSLPVTWLRANTARLFANVPDAYSACRPR